MKLRLLMCVAASCLAGGCLSPKTSGMVVEKGRLFVHDPSFALNLETVQDVRERTPEGFLHVQVTVRNTNQTDFRCQYRFEWKTKQGLAQTQAMTPWRPTVLHGKDETVFEATSTLQGAEDFRLAIRRAAP
ncbi:MAG: DUF1425 domain-containing protein [Kiritimatiellia bacterium]